MHLKDYLERNNINKNAFSRACGVSSGTLYNFLNRRRDLHISVALRIERVTHGAVTMQEMAAHVIPVKTGDGSRVPQPHRRKKQIENKSSNT